MKKKIHARLLSEIITHENFLRLMVDAEIYVDGLADMQIQNLNFAVDHIREKIKLTEKNLSAGEQFLGISEICPCQVKSKKF